MSLMYRAAMASYEEIEAMLVDAGANEEVAREVVATLGLRLSPRKTQRWLADPERAHVIEDPESAERLCAFDAVSAGKADLVLAEARRFIT